MSHRVLVIDHHPQGLQRVVDPLRQAGYEVAVAQTVADGASTFGRFEPAIVFIAARLPRTHGTVLCRELKRTDAGASTPIVLIVEGTGVQIDLPSLDQFGADRLLQKPVSADELLAVCRELLDRDQGSTDIQEAETASQRDAEPDDGLSIALEELDSLDFDLPEEIVRKAREKSLQPTAVELSNDTGADIEDHLDDLLGDKQATAPGPSASAEPSTGQDHDADAAVIDQLDLDSELNMTLGAGKAPAPARQPSPATPSRAAVPPAPAVTATVSESPPPSEQAVGRFQTEAFTSRRAMPQPFPLVAEARPVAGLARWSWVAIPLTVAIVFLAVFFMGRPRVSPPEQLLDVAAPAGGEFTGAGFSLALDPIDETDPPISSIESVQERVPETLAPAVVAVDSPRKPERRQPAPAIAAPTKTRQDPIVEKRPEAVQQVEPEPEPVAKTATPSIEPVVDDAPSLQTLPEPITRDPILIQRVEPRVTKKDLKKGGVVVLRIRINETGGVTRVLVDQGIPGSRLEAAAVAAVLRWRYEPALDHDKPVEAWTTARFTFE